MLHDICLTFVRCCLSIRANDLLGPKQVLLKLVFNRPGRVMTLNRLLAGTGRPCRLMGAYMQLVEVLVKSRK